jgi:hypothetical protein
MSFTESNTVEQMIFDAATSLIIDGKQNCIFLHELF